MFTWDEVIDVALGIEQAGEESYRQAAKTAHDPSISQALEWLADDEARHQKWFASLRTQQSATQPTSKMEKISRALMRDLAESQAQFHQTEKLISTTDLTDSIDHSHGDRKRDRPLLRSDRLDVG